MAKYSKAAQAKMEIVMREYKHGELKSGKSGEPVKSRKQAIAIGLSEARKRGYKAPESPSKSKKSSKPKVRSKSTTKRTSKARSKK